MYSCKSLHLLNRPIFMRTHKRSLLGYLIITSALNVNAQALSAGSSLRDLPQGTALLLRKNIALKPHPWAAKYTGKEAEEGWYWHKTGFNTKANTQEGFVITCEKQIEFSSVPRTVFILMKPEFRQIKMMTASDYEYTSHSIIYGLTAKINGSDEQCKITLQLVENEFPQTIEGALPYLNDVFSFVESDPYAEFDDETASRILMKKITNGIASGDHIEALANFSLLENRSTDLPEEFYYFYARSLKETGHKPQAMLYATKYLSKYGKSGRYYQKTIDMVAEF